MSVMACLKRNIEVALILIIVGVLTGCARNPATGEKELALVSESQEVALGQQSHPEILAQFGRIEDEALQSYFSEIGQEMAAISHRPDLPWTFTVVDDPLVNAFALPGGYIYFTRGILAYMNNEAEMAGVLGHEIGHVTARHAVNQMSRAQLFGLGLGLGSIFSPTFRQFSDLAQMGVGLLFLKYGRDDERESDQLGIEYMYEMGYDPREMSDFFQVFQRMSEESGQSMPGWLSSHPTPPSRIRDTQQLAQEILSRSPGSRDLKVRPDRFLRHLDGIIFGENPREGFTQDGHFYHPDMRFQMDYPSAWKVQNGKSAVVFVEPSQNAGVQLTLAPSETPSPEARARQIGQQPNVRMLRGSRESINGKSAYVAVYDIQGQSGSGLRAIAAFLLHRDLMFQLVGMAPPSVFNRYSRQLQQVITSFRDLNDREILAVQPDRLDLYTIQRGGTIEDVARLFPNERVSVDDLALLNRVERGEDLGPGTVVKIVRAGRRP